jgi:hypothetical protein
VAESIGSVAGGQYNLQGAIERLYQNKCGKLHDPASWSATLRLDLQENNTSIVLEENQEEVSKLPAALAYGLIHRGCSPAGLAAHAV